MEVCRDRAEFAARPPTDMAGRAPSRRPRLGAARGAPRCAASEPEASQAARLGAQHDRRGAWLDAIHVPWRWSLRRCVERGGDARPALVGFRRPTLVRPRLREHAPPCPGRSPVLRHRRRRRPRRGSTRRSSRRGSRCDVASLSRACARLEPERAIQPEGADRRHMRAAVLVDRREPRRASVVRVRSRRRSCIELLGYGRPVHRRQPVLCTQVDDLHGAFPFVAGDTCATACRRSDVPWSAKSSRLGKSHTGAVRTARSIDHSGAVVTDRSRADSQAVINTEDAACAALTAKVRHDIRSRPPDRTAKRSRRRHRRRRVRPASRTAARCPADVADHRRRSPRRTGRPQHAGIRHAPVEPAHPVHDDGGLRPHPDLTKPTHEP